ncbi:leucine-rich repeat domain-containing protein [Blastopirellula retiformator]|uniref:Leucine Rich repeats (2 copies) n=1 Tax=Blastopirellula retiformator TaxID=2527970 RepID=A0A5C5VKX3_9BACT|nr:hypothetical protein [Blastopirellula retiformator]TWT39274.1 Leucine Rich repeats (2 copies) [Blastopirellula retiformator]
MLAPLLVSLSLLAADPALDRATLDARFQSELTQLADKCDELEMPQQAAATRGWLLERRPIYNYAVMVPESDPLKPTGQPTQLIAFWYERLTSLRQAYAEQLFQLARQELTADRADVAYRLIHDVLRENPDHTEARRILGYRQVGGVWRRPGVTTRVKQLRLDHPKFPWPARTYWLIESPHFEISTNHSEQAGLELAEKLEQLYSAWEQIFFDYWSNSRQLKSYFDGATPSPSRKKFHIAYFRSRQEYVDYLTPLEPQAAMTLGIYLFKKEEAYFFASDDPAAQSTWLHEATHQLFHEYRSAPAEIGTTANFWAIEGAALYMESVRMFDGYCTIGGFDASRLQFARNRRLVGEFHLPVGELTGLSREQLQKHPDIRPLYSEAAGLAHYWMDGDAAQYRRPFIDYLRTIYLGRDHARSLEETTGLSPSQIDDSYARFLQVDDAMLEQLDPAGPTVDLALGRTAVTDEGMTSIGKLPQLTWLDLTGTKVTSAGVRQLQTPQLRDLGLGGTATTDAATPSIAKLAKLGELDLSGTAITDAGLKPLAQLDQLQILRLAVTRITDAGLAELARCAQLRALDLRRTLTTPAGVAKIKQAIPSLQVTTDDQ